MSRGDFIRSHKRYTSAEIEQLKSLSQTHTSHEIAEIMNRSPKGVSGAMERLNISCPSGSAKRSCKMQKALSDKYGVPLEWLLKTMHWTLELPIKNGMDIKLDLSARTIMRWMEKFAIPRRSVSDDNYRNVAEDPVACSGDECHPLTKPLSTMLYNISNDVVITKQHHHTPLGKREEPVGDVSNS